MRRYELMLLLRPDLEDDKLQASVEKVTRAIVNAGGSLSKVSPWGKRRLAYDIANQREASYFLIHFDIEPSQVREIERGMLITEEILRHLVTVLEDRGPVDELAPAAAPRSGEEGEEEDTSEGTSDDTSEGTSEDTSDDGDTPEAAEFATDAGSPVPPADAPAAGDAATADEPVDPDSETPAAGGDDEERAAG